MTKRDGGPEPSAIEVVVVDLIKSAALLDAEEFARPRLSAQEIARAAERHAVDGGAWRASRIALRIVLERWAGAAAPSAVFEIEPGGRPRLASGDVHFSLSHADEAALIAVSRSGPLGIDVESRRVLRITPERQARLIAAAERLAIAGDESDGSNASRVTRAWVRLEAVAKASGSGIGRLLTEAGVVGGAGRSEAKDAASLDFEVRDIDAGAHFAAAIAAPRLPRVIDVRDFPASAAELTDFLAERR